MRPTPKASTTPATRLPSQTNVSARSIPWEADRRHVTDREYDWVDGLPVTTPRRTLDDLANSSRWEPSQLRAPANEHSFMG